MWHENTLRDSHWCLLAIVSNIFQPVHNIVPYALHPPQPATGGDDGDWDASLENRSLWPLCQSQDVPRQSQLPVPEDLESRAPQRQPPAICRKTWWLVALVVASFTLEFEGPTSERYLDAMWWTIVCWMQPLYAWQQPSHVPKASRKLKKDGRFALLSPKQRVTSPWPLDIVNSVTHETKVSWCAILSFFLYSVLLSQRHRTQTVPLWHPAIEKQSSKSAHPFSGPRPHWAPRSLQWLSGPNFTVRWLTNGMLYWCRGGHKGMLRWLTYIYIYIDMQCSEEKQKHTSPEQEVYRKIITTTEKPHTMKLTKQKHEHHKRQHRSREQEPTKTWNTTTQTSKDKMTDDGTNTIETRSQELIQKTVNNTTQSTRRKNKKQD